MRDEFLNGEIFDTKYEAKYAAKIFATRWVDAYNRRILTSKIVCLTRQRTTAKKDRKTKGNKEPTYKQAPLGQRTRSGGVAI
jgi:hypothetical protein